MGERVTSRLRRLLCAYACLAALTVFGCSPRSVVSPSSSPPATASGVASVGVTESVVGTWVPTPSAPATFPVAVQWIELRSQGVILQRVRSRSKGASTNRGLWREAGQGTLYFELNTLGMGVSKGFYRFESTGDSLTLTFTSGDAWVTGTNHLIQHYVRER